jgi:hypothetical protein
MAYEAEKRNHAHPYLVTVKPIHWLAAACVALLALWSLSGDDDSSQSEDMSTATKPKPTRARRAAKPAQRAKIKFPKGSLFAGLEDSFGAVSIDVPPEGPKRRAYIRARILADHNT